MILTPFNGFVPNYGRKGGWEGGGKREVGFFFFIFHAQRVERPWNESYGTVIGRSKILNGC